MKQGLIIGKFMPLHLGHLALIDFAAERCDELRVLIGSLPGEPIPGTLRARWLWETYRERKNIVIEHTDEELPSSETSSYDVSRVWARWLSAHFPSARIVFSSEAYGAYLAEHMGITHVPFDPARAAVPVSASQIRRDPLLNWDYIAPAARPYFLKKVCLVGPESTGKSVLAEKLAARYRTSYVPEVARALVDQKGLSFELMPEILVKHADAILDAEKSAARLLFVDTDHRTTLHYSRLFYGKEPPVPPWVQAANRYDLYLFLDIDCPFVHDQQRFTEGKRDAQRAEMLADLETAGVACEVIGGNWEERETAAVRAIESRWKMPPSC